jgi:hypothetical protein
MSLGPYGRRLLPICRPPAEPLLVRKLSPQRCRVRPGPHDPGGRRLVGLANRPRPALGLVEGKKLRLPKAANQAAGRRAGLTYGRAGAYRRGPAGRDDRRRAAAAEPRRSRAALQLRRTMKAGRMSRLSFRPVSGRSCSGGKPCTAITRPACFSPPSRGSSKGQPCCLIRHRPSRRYPRNRRYPRSRNRRYPRSRNRRYRRTDHEGPGGVLA